MKKTIPQTALSLVLTLAMVALPLRVQAQIFICKDAAGHTLTADHPITECSNRPMRELDRNGITRREIAPPLTAQQKREREAQLEKRRVEAAAVEALRLKDRALMTRYRNEADIQAARQQAIDLLNEQMRFDTETLSQEMKEMKSAEAALLATKTVSRRVAANRTLQQANRAVELRLSSIEQRNADIDRTHKKFDLSLKRFKEIKAANESDSAARGE
jgi:hypothetical protein